MDNRQGPVAALQVGAEDPEGGHVDDFVERLLLALHFAPDAIEVLGPATHLTVVQPRGGEAIPQQLHGHPQALFPVTALGRHLLLNVAVGLGLEDFEGQILQLPLEPANPQPVGEGGIDLPGFAGDALLLLWLEGRQRAHVVEAVCQLHQHHADVAGHGQKHATQIFCLGLGVVGEMDPAQLGDPLHQGPHLGAEASLDLIGGDAGVLDHVVQEAGGDYPCTGAGLPQQIGNGDRMDDVRLARGPQLALVVAVGVIEGAGEEQLGVRRAAVVLARRHVLQAALQPLGQGHAIVSWGADRSVLIKIGNRLEHSALWISSIVCRYCLAGDHDQPRACD